jgi:hypothetical protein
VPYYVPTRSKIQLKSVSDALVLKIVVIELQILLSTIVHPANFTTQQTHDYVFLAQMHLKLAFQTTLGIIFFGKFTLWTQTILIYGALNNRKDDDRDSFDLFPYTFSYGNFLNLPVRNSAQ